MREIPTISIVFDDNSDTIYSEGFVRMQALSLVGSVFIISNNVGGVNLLTEAELNEMYGAGWDISNHTLLHTDLAVASGSAISDAVVNGRDRLTQAGREWLRSADLFVYPFNSFDAESQSIVEPLVKYCTTNSSQGGLYNSYPLADLKHIQRAAVGTNTVATVKSFIDYTIANNVYTHLYFHGIAEPLSITYPPDMFQEVIEYIAKKRNAGQVRVVTCSQLTREDNPTTVSLTGTITPN